MTQSPKYTYRKIDKLKSRKQINLLFKEGKAIQSYPLRLIYRFENPDHVLQASVTVSTRYFKKAVDRNRIKRLMREAYRLQKQEISDKLLTQQKSMSLFMLYTGQEMPEYEQVYEAMKQALKKIDSIIDATH